jgi:aspartate oxidase
MMHIVPGAFDDVTNIKWMPMYVQILRVLEEDELENVLRQIRELAQEVLATGEHRKCEIEDMVEMAMMVAQAALSFSRSEATTNRRSMPPKINSWNG